MEFSIFHFTRFEHIHNIDTFLKPVGMVLILLSDPQII